MPREPSPALPREPLLTTPRPPQLSAGAVTERVIAYSTELSEELSRQ